MCFNDGAVHGRLLIKFLFISKWNRNSGRGLETWKLETKTRTFLNKASLTHWNKATDSVTIIMRCRAGWKALWWWLYRSYAHQTEKVSCLFLNTKTWNKNKKNNNKNIKQKTRIIKNKLFIFSFFDLLQIFPRINFFMAFTDFQSNWIRFDETTL